MEKCHTDEHDCGTSMYCDITVNRCQDCHFICNKQRTPDFKECQELCFDVYNNLHGDTIEEELKPFTTKAATETHPATISPLESETPVLIIALIMSILVISVALLAISLYCFTSKSNIADKNGKARRPSDCSGVEYISHREDDRHRVQVAGAPLMQLGVSQSLHPHYQQHKSRKNSRAVDTGDENVALIHNCDVNKTSLSGKQTIHLNQKEKQEILNYYHDSNKNMTGTSGEDNTIIDLVDVSNNLTDNHNKNILNDNGNPSKVKGCGHNNDTRKQKQQNREPKSGKTQQHLIIKIDADNTREDYSSFEVYSDLSYAREQVNVGVGSFTAEITTPSNAKPNSARVEDHRNEEDNNNRKKVYQIQRLNVSIMGGSAAKTKPIRPDGILFDCTNNSKPVTPSEILFATNKGEGATAHRVVDSVLSDVKCLPAPGYVRSQAELMQSGYKDKKQVNIVNEAEEQNKDTLFSIDEYYSSHVKPDLAASELPHTPRFTEQSLLEVQRTGEVKTVSLLNEAIKLLDNDEVFKNVQMRTYTESENEQVQRSSEQSSNGDTILKSQYTVDGELILQQNNLMSTDPQQVYITSTPVIQENKLTPVKQKINLSTVNQQNNMTPIYQNNNFTSVNQHSNLTPVNKSYAITHVNLSNLATINNITFPNNNGHPIIADSGILLNGQVESNMYRAPVYHTSELNAPVCQPSDIGVLPGPSAVIGESSQPVGDKVSKPKPHPNKRLYEVLKHIDWVDGYYSEGHSIEVYADLEHITPEVALKELSVRTGAPPEKFNVKQNDSILA